MYITVKGLTYAKLTSGGNGSAPAYSNGAIAENLTVKADINFQYAEGQDHADGVRIAHKKQMTGVNTSFEPADLPSAIKKALLGWQVATSDLVIDETDPDYYGIGFYIWNETPVSETDQWICYWIYKSKFSADNISVSTATDSISYQHQTINGVGEGVQLTSGGKMSFVITNDEPLSTEAAAVAWLKAKGNISSGT